jgi:hypothetical protein
MKCRRPDITTGCPPKSWPGVADDSSWTQKIWEVLEGRPVLAGSFGVAISSLLLGGIVYSLTITQPAIVAEAPVPNHTELVFNEPVGALPDPGMASSLMVSSTNPVVDPLGPAGLFDGVRLHRQSPVPVNLNFGGN